MPIRQIIVCFSIFFAILLAGYWLNYQTNQPMKSHQFFIYWKDDVMLPEELRANASYTSFFPREYVRILPKIDDGSDTAPTLP